MRLDERKGIATTIEIHSHARDVVETVVIPENGGPEPDDPVRIGVLCVAGQRCPWLRERSGR